MTLFFFFSSRRRHTRYWRDWSSDVCSSDLTSSRSKDEYPFPLYSLFVHTAPIEATSIFAPSTKISLCTKFTQETGLLSSTIIRIFSLLSLFKSMGNSYCIVGLYPLLVLNILLINNITFSYSLFFVSLGPSIISS